MAYFNRVAAERAEKERKKFEQFKQKLSKGTAEEKFAFQYIEDIERENEIAKKDLEDLRVDLFKLGALYKKLGIA